MGTTRREEQIGRGAYEAVPDADTVRRAAKDLRSAGIHTLGGTPIGVLESCAIDNLRSGTPSLAASVLVFAYMTMTQQRLRCAQA